ncbi:MAG: diguanylate cyclase [Chloroflexi bacterium]|nr:diguanylate cyclase [Chloroflexota bacterium]
MTGPNSAPPPSGEGDAARLRALVEVAHRLSDAPDREHILTTVVSETSRLLGSDVTTIRILRDGRLELAAAAGLSDEQRDQWPVLKLDDSWYADLLRAGRPWWSDDIATLDSKDWFRHYPGDVKVRGDVLVPLLHHGLVIGALASVTWQPRHWSAADIEVVSALGAHAAVAIHNADVLEEMQRRAAQLAVVQAASARMNRARTVEAVGRAIVEELHRMIDYHNARVYIVEAPDDVVPIAFSGRVAAYENVDMDLLRTKLGEGFTGWTALHGEPLRIPDAYADERAFHIPGTPKVEESMLTVPLRYDDAVIGVITLSKLGLDQFNENDLQLLEILADQAAVAIESARLLDRTQTLAAEARGLLDLSAELTQSLNPNEVAVAISRHVQAALGVDLCSISTWDRANDQVVTTGMWPEDAASVGETFPLSDFPETRRVLETRATVVVDADDPGADPAETRILREGGARTLAMFPLIVKGQSVGLVELWTNGPWTWDERRLNLARTMTNEAAVALENARLYDSARSLADRDPLTGLYNHRFLHERLGEEMLRAARAHQPLSILMLDIDDFKLVNDTFGHQVGDQFLVRLASVVRSTLRGSDIPARYGGEEFSVILPDAGEEAGDHTAARIHDALRSQSFKPEGRGEVSISVSIGRATFPVDGRTATELIERADARMYEAKAVHHGTARPMRRIAPASA